jgi:hypothetical protein
MKGGTADISSIAKFGWYEWVMFRNNLPSFPDNKLTLGRYLGPSIDVGSALTAKILKSNGQFVCRFVVLRLNDNKLTCPIHTALQQWFDNNISRELGPAAQSSDFPVEDMTPNPIHYDETFDADPNLGDLEVTPEEGDFYVNAEIMLPKGDTMSKGHVRIRKRDIDGNVI